MRRQTKIDSCMKPIGFSNKNISDVDIFVNKKDNEYFVFINKLTTKQNHQQTNQTNKNPTHNAVFTFAEYEECDRILHKRVKNAFCEK